MMAPLLAALPLFALSIAAAYAAVLTAGGGGGGGAATTGCGCGLLMSATVMISGRAILAAVAGSRRAGGGGRGRGRRGDGGVRLRLVDVGDRHALRPDDHRRDGVLARGGEVDARRLHLELAVVEAVHEAELDLRHAEELVGGVAFVDPDLLRGVRVVGGASARIGIGDARSRRALRRGDRRRALPAGAKDSRGDAEERQDLAAVAHRAFRFPRGKLLVGVLPARFLVGLGG